MDGDLDLTPGQRRLLAVYRRWGPSFLIRAITLASVLLSVIAVGLAVLIEQPSFTSVVVDLTIAVAVPGIVAPLMSTVAVNLLGVVAKAYDNLQVVATTDTLTGVANRRRFFEEATRSADRLAEGQSLIVGMLDLNWFKTINDTFGHAVGDAALVAVARRLTEAAGPQALVARLGGDEFAFLVPSPPTDSQHLIETLFAAVVDVPVRGEVVVSASIGAARLDPTMSVDAALALADAELYAAKQRRSRLTVQNN